MAYTHEIEMNKLLDNSEMTGPRWRTWSLAALGLYIDGFDLFIIGVAMPLLTKQWGLSPIMEGTLGVAALVGAVFGAVFSGYLSDRIGRKLFFTVDLLVLMGAAILCSLSWNVYSLIAFRFILGLGIGAEYPVSAAFISEAVPMRIRGRMLIAGFSFQSLGMLSAGLAGLLVLKVLPGHLWDWRIMLVCDLIPATIALILRSRMSPSIRWLLSKGRSEEAAVVMLKYLPNHSEEIDAVLARPNEELREEMQEKLGVGALFQKKYLRRTILSSVPWFLMDVATYGIGLFTPVILAQMAFHSGDHSVFGTELQAVEGTAFVDIFLVLGFVMNFFLVEKLGRIKLQNAGFLGMTAGLAVLGVAALLPGGPSNHLALVLIGFVVFNVLMNMGPNATTYILPVELYPTKVRATGHGFAAAAGKFGAVLGVFFLPVIQEKWGISAVMFSVAGVTFLGFLVTVIFKVETMGKSLDQIQAEQAK